MPESDLMDALRSSYQEVVARKTHPRVRVKTSSVSSVRRYLRYIMDVLDIYLDIQRDRRWRDDDW